MHAQVQQPLVAEVPPVLEPLQVGAGLAEELQLHLLELPGAEGEVAGVISLRKDLPIWHTPKGSFFRVVRWMFWKLTKMPWAVSGQVNGVLGVLGDALEGLEHQVELADVGEVVLAAGGAGDLVPVDEGHLLLAEGVYGFLQGAAVLAHQPSMSLSARKRSCSPCSPSGIGEAAHMAGGHPGLGVHEDGGVQAHVVGGSPERTSSTRPA